MFSWGLLFGEVGLFQELSQSCSYSVSCTNKELPDGLQNKNGNELALGGEGLSERRSSLQMSVKRFLLSEKVIFKRLHHGPFSTLNLDRDKYHKHQFNSENPSVQSPQWLWEAKEGVTGSQVPKQPWSLRIRLLQDPGTWFSKPLRTQRAEPSPTGTSTTPRNYWVHAEKHRKAILSIFKYEKT